MIKKAEIGVFITKSKGRSDFTMHEQTDRGVSSAGHTILRGLFEEEVRRTTVAHKHLTPLALFFIVFDSIDVVVDWLLMLVMLV